MIEIEIDCNSDEIILFDNEREIQTIKFNDNSQRVINWFSELFNRIDPRIKGELEILGVELSRIDEDTRKTLEEW